MICDSDMNTSTTEPGFLGCAKNSREETRSMITHRGVESETWAIRRRELFQT